MLRKKEVKHKLDKKNTFKNMLCKTNNKTIKIKVMNLTRLNFLYKIMLNAIESIIYRLE